MQPAEFSLYLLSLLFLVEMSAADGDDTQSAYGEGAGGPGAPTPLSALEVKSIFPRRSFV